MSLFTVDDIGSLNRLTFSPDPISRFQYEKVHEAKKGVAEHQAERDLMLAVLEDGIACFQGYFSKPSRTSEKLFLETEEWINSNDDGVFSFNNVCETLGLDPDALRKGLRGVAGRADPQSPMGEKTSSLKQRKNAPGKTRRHLEN